MVGPIGPNLGQRILSMLGGVRVIVGGVQYEVTGQSNNLVLYQRQLTYVRQTTNQLVRITNRIDQSTNQIIRTDDPRIFQRLQQILRKTARLLEESEAIREQIQTLEELVQSIYEQNDALFEDIKILNEEMERNHQATISSLTSIDATVENLEETLLAEARALGTSINTVRASVFALRRGFLLFRVQTGRRLDDLSARLTTANGLLRSLQRRFLTFQQILNGVRQGILDINRVINLINRNLFTIREEIVVINQIVATTAGEVSTILSEVTTISGAVFAIATEVSAVAASLGLVAGEVTAILGEVTLILPAVELVQSAVAVNKTLLYGISGEVAYNSYVLSGKIQATHAVTLQKIAALSTQVERNKQVFLQKFKGVDSKLQKVQDTTQKVKKKVDGFDEDFKKIKKDFKELNKKVKTIEKSIKKLPEETSDQVSFKVVGESYFRYDSTSSFYPTLFFRYKEDIEGPRARVSQIKMKLKKKGQEITDQDIENLKNRCQLIKDEKYKWGSIRGNYVSKDKRFKTTVFGKDQDSVKQILKAIMPLVDETFEEANLTFNR
jgi:conjugal transfer/entry exclusion protein